MRVPVFSFAQQLVAIVRDCIFIHRCRFWEVVCKLLVFSALSMPFQKFNF